MRVSVQNLGKRYGGFRALDGVSFVVEPGEIVGLLGANGTGKTTLLRCLATVLTPSAGEIQFDGERLQRSRLDLRRRLFFLPDFPPVHPHLTLVRHIALVMHLYGRDTDDTASDTVFRHLESLDLLECARAPMAALSRGQVYKAALAAMMSVDAELVLLDEPFASGMDPHGIFVFRQWARAAAGRPRTVIYSTQILEVAETFADRVAILQGGRLQAFETLTALRERMGDSSRGVLAAVLEQLREPMA